MKNISLIVLLFLSVTGLFCTEFNFSNLQFSLKTNTNSSFTSTGVFSDYFSTNKPKIFDKPDMSWFKEKGRLEKLSLFGGAVSVTIGSALLLSGLLLYFLKPTAQSQTNDYTFLSLIGVGGGLTVLGIPFLITGAIRLRIVTKK